MYVKSKSIWSATSDPTSEEKDKASPLWFRCQGREVWEEWAGGEWACRLGVKECSYPRS